MALAEDRDIFVDPHPSGQVELGDLTTVGPEWSDVDEQAYRKLLSTGRGFEDLDDIKLIADPKYRIHDPIQTLMDVLDYQIKLMRQDQKAFESRRSIRKVFGIDSKFAKERKALESFYREVKVLQKLIQNPDRTKETVIKRLKSAQQSLREFSSVKKHWGICTLHGTF